MSARYVVPWASVVAQALASRAGRRRAKRLRVVDLFCGAGGASWGATLAGLEVVAAVNHDPLAIRAHARAIPWAAHLCEDLERLSPMAVPSHDVLWASPECTGHTRARGGEREHHEATRSTAFCPVRVADLHRPRVAIVENVPDFERWELIEGWLALWRCMGYRKQVVRLNAADLGVPQARVRTFFVFTCERRVCVAPDLTPPRLAHEPVRSVLDLDTTRGRWSRWREDYVPESVARIADAVAHQGPACLVPYYGSESSHRGWSLDRPCGTLTRRDRYCLVIGEHARVFTVDETKAVGGFPADYPLEGSKNQQKAAVGASVVPACAQWLCERVAEVC